MLKPVWTGAAGAQLSPDVVSTDANAVAHVRGSWAIVQADNTEQIWELLRVDPYWENSVVRTFTCDPQARWKPHNRPNAQWDTEKVSIVPVLIGRGNIQ